MKKLERDGKVAVLVSPGFGAGWSTWNREFPDMLFDPDIAQALLNSDRDKAEVLTKEKYPAAYEGGLRDLEVQWLDKGTRFFIHEYDGNEHVEIITPDYGFVA